MDSFVSLARSFLRIIIWFILQFIFVFVDLVYDAIKALATFNILKGNGVWNYFTYFIYAFLGFFIIFRLMKRYIKTLVDDEEAEHFKPINIILKLAAIGFLLTIVPFLLQSFGQLLSDLVDKINIIFGGDNASKFSHTLLKLSDIPEEQWGDWANFDINLKEDGKFKYLSDPTNLICLLVASAFSVYLMGLIGIQMGQRIIGMILKLILAPWSFSSIIDEKNESFSSWWRLFIADFMSTYMQMILLVIGCTLFTNIHFSDKFFVNSLTQVIAVIGCLLAVQNAPNGVSQLLGSDIGTTNALQSISSGQNAINAGKFAGNLVAGAGALAVYGAGRTLGGKSIAQQASESSAAGGEQIISGTIQGITGKIQNTGGFSGFHDGSGGGATSAEPAAGATTEAESSIQTNSIPIDFTMKQAPKQNTTLVNTDRKLNPASFVANQANQGNRMAKVMSRSAGVMYGLASNRVANMKKKPNNNLRQNNFSRPQKMTLGQNIPNNNSYNDIYRDQRQDFGQDFRKDFR